MYPEESFVEVSERVIEERWAREPEWWRKDESVDLQIGAGMGGGIGKRVGWRCRCGVGWWVRVVEFKDFGLGEGAGGDWW